METWGVGKFKLTVFSDLTLKLETSKSLGKFPESHVTTTSSEKDVVWERREACFENFLTERFTL